jgi:hypothetical protein
MEPCEMGHANGMVCQLTEACHKGVMPKHECHNKLTACNEMGNSRELKFTRLNVLADIVARIDSNKNKRDISLLKLVDEGMGVIAMMKLEQQAIDTLQIKFANLRILLSEPDLLSQMIDEVHEEIICLLGDDAERIYASF